MNVNSYLIYIFSVGMYSFVYCAYSSLGLFRNSNGTEVYVQTHYTYLYLTTRLLAGFSSRPILFSLFCLVHLPRN